MQLTAQLRDGACRAAASRGSLLACLAALVVLLGAEPAEAAFEGKNGPIAFDRGGDIWTMARSGKGEKSVIQNPTLVEGQPAWSADGEMIAFQEGMADTASSIGVARANGNRRKTVTNTNSTPGVFDEGPSWTPGGKTIVFERDFVSAGPAATTNADLYTVNVRTKRERPLLEGSTDDDDPAVSPNGRRIAFVRSSETSQDTIYLMRSNGAGLRALTPGSDPTWSPDGKQIAFERDESLYVVTVRNGQVQPVAGASSGQQENPAWSPNGRFLLFVDERREDHIAMVKATGGRVNALTRAGAPAEENPDWGTRS
jgi:Tol biopolymer transport system component